MQQRRVRLGDILDDYCPRERRITNHAVVAMVEDDVKQTRCTTCDADHEYKDGKVPAARRRKSEGVLAAVDADSRPGLIAADVNTADEDDPLDDPIESAEPAEPAVFATPAAAPDIARPAIADALSAAADEDDEIQPSDRDEWPVHRPLIRATLPRPEGQVPERKEPDFTMRQSRFDGNRNGQRHNRGGRRQAQGQPGQFGQYGHRSPGQGQGQGQGQGGERNGNRAPQPGHRGGGRPGGQGGQRPGGGRGPKRGR
jgi:hypothetical protein